MSVKRKLPKKRTYTLTEAAALLGTNRWSARREVNATGCLAGVPAIRLSAKTTVFSKAAIDRIVNGESSEAA